ncbi:MAG: leucine--tRNA ligase [Cytophagales bacterium]
MSVYNPQEIEKKWQKYWAENKSFRTEQPSNKPKYFALDMFPYPSGAGLHVGHPLGYIATDIVSRYKRLKGFNVLHPMGYDSFGLPAEQYAIQTGQHPDITTRENINRYRQQLDNLGFSYDWDREVRTSNTDYYKWTQWIFIQLFNSWYNKETDKAESIETLISKFELNGNKEVKAVADEDIKSFTADEWEDFSDEEQHAITLKYRLAYLANTFVNWCPGLGTVLANEEVKDGVSERGGFPVIRKEMPQWQLRITAYAERLINDLDLVDWPEPIKEQQRNWIGKSKGCMVSFAIDLPSFQNLEGLTIQVFTTRVDTLFGVTYLTLAPEHELIDKITTQEQKEAVAKYVHYAKNRSERDRQADVKTISGEFTGAYAINPFNNEKVPIWIGEYVLAGYGTGAVMAVPSSDTRDYNFAKHFNLPIIQVQEGDHTDISKEDFDPKAGTMINSGFLNGMVVKDAIDAAIKKVEELGVGYGKVNFRIRDSIFSRQRYWGEPIPIFYKDGLPYTLPESELPLVLPEVDKFLPTEDGEPPLARAKDWKYETNTMPGWAGSSWYFFRYMDPKNDKEFASKEALEYWQEVDLYLGGSEHATGHLLYSRFWTKFLYDLGLIKTKEYAKKLINQGMIQGRSNLVYKISMTNIFISKGWKDKLTSINSNEELVEISKEFNKQLNRIEFIQTKEDTSGTSEVYSHISILEGSKFNNGQYVDVNIVENDVLDVGKFKNYREDYKNAEFIREDGKYICGFEVEKMSKSKLNVVNPDDVVDKFGADTLRLYEMFLGPLEMSKPWNTNSISGVSRFLRNVWKLFFDENGHFLVTDEAPNDKELKALHKTIKKVEEDIERFSFNTSVSTFMVCVNELSDLKCHKKAILKDLLIVLAPYAPHIAEELWEKLGNTTSITYAEFPKFEEKYLTESSFEYPISINGKVRHKMVFALDATAQQVESEAIATPEIQKWLEGKAPKKVIVVPGKIVNVVL